MEETALRFLVVDDNGDSRQLLVNTLARKYPGALFHEFHNGDPAVVAAQRTDISAIIAHRTYDYDGETLVRLFRRANPTVPIIMVSGYDRTARAIAAGADAFLNYDRWLMIGTVVAEMMAAKNSGASLPPFRAQVAGDELSAQSA
jgi:CheY-like chemotaxis protein